jgi:hypothetical protein
MAGNQRETEERQRQQQQQMLQLALRGPIPRFHANHCAIGQTPTDMAVIFVSNNSPVATVNLSYETAKFVAKEIEKAIAQYETVSGIKLPEPAEIIEKMRLQMESQNASQL